MSTLMKFVYEGNTLQFEDGAEYPATRRAELMQVQDRTAAGTLQVEDLGIAINSRVLYFTLMTKNDYDALIDWYLNIVNGASKVFEFTDEYGIVRNAIIIDSFLEFNEVSLNRYSGQFTVEYK